MNLYETDDLVSQYLTFHYGACYFGVANYPQQCAALCVEAMQGQPAGRALDLGCAVGRSTFELARTFKEVVGVDLSSRFIDSANTLKEHARMGYFQREQGDLGELLQADLTTLGLDSTRHRVSFVNEDACTLPTNGDYDLVFAGNLIDRLHDPRACLRNLHRHLKIGGVLVISSPYTLTTDYTPRENWIGGYMEGPQRVTVMDGLKENLLPCFRLEQEPMDLPFVIRETSRKFQHTIAEVSIWRRVI